MPRHHIIIGNGVAGCQAAITLRAREADARITLITASPLHLLNRYDLPKVFTGRRDWREFLVYPPAFYDEQRITVRRATRVSSVDTQRRVVILGHKEELPFDTLLVASGGRAHLPEELSEFRPLMHGFGGFELAVAVADALPPGGRVVMLGGDMMGVDLAHTLVDAGYHVTLVAGEATFWPHEVAGEERAHFLDALRGIGVDVVETAEAGGVAAVERGASGLPPRRVVFGDGSDRWGDVVMPFFGLTPAVEFMLGTGVDIERGLLVNPQLRTTHEAIYAAGDVCQIWDDASRRYRFSYGWQSVRVMGELAAMNMTGGNEPFVPGPDEQLRLTDDGRITSPYWEHE